MGQITTISEIRKVEKICGGIVDGGFSSALYWSRSAKRWLFDGTSGLRPWRIDFITESCLQVYWPCCKAAIQVVSSSRS